MISTERNPERTAWALDRGAYAFLQKPFYAADIDRLFHGIFGLRMPELAVLDKTAEPAGTPTQPAEPVVRRAHRSQAQAAAIARNSSAFRLAPPTSAPSTLATTISSRALAGLTDPP